MRLRRSLIRLLFVQCLAAAALVLTNPSTAFACGSCITCGSAGNKAVCIAGGQNYLSCGTINTYCTYTCVWNPPSGTYVPSNVNCGSGCGSPNCWSCCPS